MEDNTPGSSFNGPPDPDSDQILQQTCIVGISLDIGLLRGREKRKDVANYKHADHEADKKNGLLGSVLHGDQLPAAQMIPIDRKKT